MDSQELKRRRKARFRTQAEAAEFFEVSRDLIAKLEGGKRPITKIHAIAFDAVLPRVEG